MDLPSSLEGLIAAVVTAVGGVTSALGIFAMGEIRQRRKLRDKQMQLTELETEERLAAARKRMATDAAAMAEEVGRAQKLSGAAKAAIAVDKAKQLLDRSAAVPSLEGAELRDLVRLGVATMRRESLPASVVLTPSSLPPAAATDIDVEHVESLPPSDDDDEQRATPLPPLKQRPILPPRGKP